jgi:hypothetical protein
MSALPHLARRFFGSLSRRELPAAEIGWALAALQPEEARLWQRMSVQDRRHSALVARRFAAQYPEYTRAELAGALLHDVGKLASGLGTIRRVIATVVGPHTESFRRYHDHERLGADMLTEIGSDAVTVGLVRGRGDAAAALRAADDV